GDSLAGASPLRYASSVPQVAGGYKSSHPGMSPILSQPVLVQRGEPAHHGCVVLEQVALGVRQLAPRAARVGELERDPAAVRVEVAPKLVIAGLVDVLPGQVVDGGLRVLGLGLVPWSAGVGGAGAGGIVGGHGGLLGVVVR